MSLAECQIILKSLICLIKNSHLILIIVVVAKRDEGKSLLFYVSLSFTFVLQSSPTLFFAYSHFSLCTVWKIILLLLSVWPFHTSVEGGVMFLRSRSIQQIIATTEWLRPKEPFRCMRMLLYTMNWPFFPCSEMYNAVLCRVISFLLRKQEEGDSWK